MIVGKTYLLFNEHPVFSHVATESLLNCLFFWLFGKTKTGVILN